MYKLVVLISLYFVSFQSGAGSESDYQVKWCDQNDGIAEYVLSDRTRIDCLTQEHAIEFDFAKKWKDAIGQSLHYSLMTGKKAAIILIYQKPSDIRYHQALKRVIEGNNLPIEVWFIDSP